MRTAAWLAAAWMIAGASEARAQSAAVAIEPATWITADDYPPAAIRAGEQGAVATIITVSPDGRVSDCRIDVSSGSALLDERTCAILRERGRFRPARDAVGRSTVATLARRIVWAIPEGDDLLLRPHESRLVLTLDANGSIVACDAGHGPMPCDPLNDMARALVGRFKPALPARLVLDKSIRLLAPGTVPVMPPVEGRLLDRHETIVTIGADGSPSCAEKPARPDDAENPYCRPGAHYATDDKGTPAIPGQHFQVLDTVRRLDR